MLNHAPAADHRIGRLVVGPADANWDEAPRGRDMFMANHPIAPAE